MGILIVIVKYSGALNKHQVIRIKISCSKDIRRSAALVSLKEATLKFIHNIFTVYDHVEELLLNAIDAKGGTVNVTESRRIA